MKIPKYIKKDRRTYEFVKIYPNYIQYEDIETKVKVCFHKSDIGLQKEMIAPPKNDLNVEKVKI